MLLMKKMVKKIFSWAREEKVDSKSDSISAVQLKQKKEKAIKHVGERYGRAITRLSDT